ncbi:hypothetical protein [Gimesia panareensis]|uniref:hypothetical protein n=1 Tax=Gimesia panareensis TaxID=2527978 RepID=UPI00118A8FC9|nr:hypothetical protein [Gimesia panareensis]QDU51251.1 hypothetical protein Pan110_36150 [Gimesia panareensis]
MGIWDFLTKPIKLTSAVFFWHEPLCYRLRLRGDLLIRCGFALAVWAAVTGIFSLLFAFNVNPPGISLAIIVGAILGLGPAWLAMFFRREHVSGSIWIYEDHLLRQRSYVSLGFFRSWQEAQEWPNAAISRCIIIPSRALGRPFSVMLLTVDSRAEIVGIPDKISLKELARHFTEAGISVEKRDSLPSRYAEGLNPIVAAAVAVAGIALLSVGLGFYFNRVPNPGNQVVVREQVPDVQQDFPQPQNPAEAIPNPLMQKKPKTKKENPPAPAPGLPNATPPNIMPKQPNLPSNRFPNRFPNRPGGPPGRPGPPNAPPNTTPKGKAAGKTHDSKLIGNPQGGGVFRTVNLKGKTLLGFRFTMGSWAGEPAVQFLHPIYDRPPAPGTGTAIVAKEGYAVGGLKIDAPKYVSAVQIIFQRVKPDGQLDPSDAYTSEWIGKPSGKETPTVDGAGKKAIGIYGRRGAIIDALGLVFE